MATKYSSKTITGYNASPPADDGSTTTSNKLEWAKHKQKLADPVKTLAEQINSALVDHFNVGPVAISVDTTTTASHYNQVLEVTGTTTISLMTASTAGKGYFVTVHNAGSGVVTVDLATGTDTLNGVTGGSVSLLKNDSMTFIVNASANGYYRIEYVDSGRATTLSSAVTLNHGDHGKTFFVDGSTAFTISFDAAVTLGAGWKAKFLMTVDTNSVTLDPNGTETIGGVATRKLNVVNDMIEVVCDGSNLQVVNESTDISFDVSQTSGQSIPDSTETLIQWPTEDRDTNGSFASNGFTVPVSGLYEINASLALDATSTGSQFELYIFVDPLGVGSPAKVKTGIVSRGNNRQGASISTLVDLNATDIVYIYAYHAGSSASKSLTTLSTINWFNGRRIK